MSGLRSRSEEESPAGTAGGEYCAVSAAPAANRPGISAEQKAQRIFLQRDFPFRLRDGGGDLRFQRRVARETQDQTRCRRPSVF